MKVTRHKWLFVLGLLLLGLRPSAGFEVPLRGEAEGRRRLVILIAADWGGHYGTDDRGFGGLAALHSYAAAKRTELRAESGALVLLHVGNLTGQTNGPAARKVLYPNGLDLIRYLALDAALLSDAERPFLPVSLGTAVRPPFVEFRNVADRASIHQTSPFPYRIVSRAGFAVFVSGLADPLRDALIDGLRTELARNRAADAQVVLLSHPPAAPAEAPNKKVAREGSRWQFQLPATGEKREQDTEPDDVAPAPGVLEKLWNRGDIANPFDRLPRGRGLTTGIVVFPSTEGDITQGTDGTLYCRVRPAHACEIELTYRVGRLIGVGGRMVHPNGERSPDPQIQPDAILTEAFPALPAK